MVEIEPIVDSATELPALIGRIQALSRAAVGLYDAMCLDKHPHGNRDSPVAPTSLLAQLVVANPVLVLPPTRLEIFNPSESLIGYHKQNPKFDVF